MCKFLSTCKMDHSSYERGGVETLSMKLLEKKKNYFRVPHWWTQCFWYSFHQSTWSDTTLNPSQKGKKGNEWGKHEQWMCPTNKPKERLHTKYYALLLTLGLHALVVSIQLSLSKAPQSNLITLSKTWPYSSVLSLLFSSLLLFEKRGLMGDGWRLLKLVQAQKMERKVGGRKKKVKKKSLLRWWGFSCVVNCNGFIFIFTLFIYY